VLFRCSAVLLFRCAGLVRPEIQGSVIVSSLPYA
jgi:hypothetical protein